MPLHGKGMLIVYNEVKPPHERDFNEWYNREHIDERVNLPGFHRARRYVAVRASPKYLATYECDTVADLATPGYLALLANQTPWSQAMMARFTHFQRLTLRVQVDLAHGAGGALTTVRGLPTTTTTYHGVATGLKDVWLAVEEAIEGVVNHRTLAELTVSAISTT